MRQTLGFLFFMLFLAGFAFVTLKNLRSAESQRNSDGNGDRISIISGSWIASSATAASDQQRFVRFHADGKISGFAGCNRFFGTFVATDSTLEVGSLATTRMACPQAVMKMEMAFLQELESATAYVIAARTMTLTGDNGTPLQLKFDSGIDN